MINVLILGQGGREHAIAWNLTKSSKIGGVYVCPGNAGTFLEKDIKKAALSCIDAHRACGYKKERGHIWPLSAGASVGKGCGECEEAIRKQQEIWGLYSYVEPFKIVQHLGDHCRKE